MKKIKKQYFAMMEVIAIIAVLMILFSAFATTINSVYRANKTFISESKAVLVLENVVEELKGRKNVSPEEVKKILSREFQLSELGKGKDYRVTIKERAGVFIIGIIRAKDRRLLAEVKL